MSTLRRFALATALTLAAGTTMTSAARADQFWDRYQNQQNRIEQGVDNGSLTRGEASRLENQEQQIRRERERLSRNGLSQHDRQVLNRDLDRESRAIHDQRHDDQYAGRGRDDNHHRRHNGDNDWWNDRR